MSGDTRETLAAAAEMLYSPLLRRPEQRAAPRGEEGMQSGQSAGIRASGAGAGRWTAGALALGAPALLGCVTTTLPVQVSASDAASTVQYNPALARIFDAAGSAWEILVYEDTTGQPAGSAALGLSVRSSATGWANRGVIGTAAQSTGLGSVTPAIGARAGGKT